MNNTKNKEESRDRLVKAIRDLHGCNAGWQESVPVKETFQGQTVWEGVVQVFELIDHPTAKKCYAWSYEADEGKRKFVAVLHQDPVKSPKDAVKAAIISGNQN